MKITKRQLRRIIREEKARIMNEIGPSRPIPNPEMKLPGEEDEGENRLYRCAQCGQAAQFGAHDDDEDE